MIIASRIEMPALSRPPSTLSTNVPATARLPSSVEAKRTPSSSAKAAISMAKGRRRPRRLRSPTQEHRRDDPERPVPAAGIAHGVVMGAQHQARQTGPVAFIASADIADRIDTRPHAGCLHPADDQFGGSTMFRCKEYSRDVVRRFRNSSQRVDAFDDLAAERLAGSSDDFLFHRNHASLFRPQARLGLE